jgi:hypothetical protein
LWLKKWFGAILRNSGWLRYCVLSWIPATIQAGDSQPKSDPSFLKIGIHISPFPIGFGGLNAQCPRSAAHFE